MYWLCKSSAHEEAQKSVSTASVSSLVLLGCRIKSIVEEHDGTSKAAKIIQSNGSTVVEGVVTPPVLPQAVWCGKEICKCY